MAETQIYLPGDSIASDLIPTSTKRRLNPSIKLNTIDTTNTTYKAATAGTLTSDFRKKTASINNPSARYQPVAGDLVIAQMKSTSADFHHLYITPFSPPAILGVLAFENATKKSRPKLEAGDLVYAKVISANRNMEVELSCVNPSSGKAEDMGEITGGMVFEVSCGFAERLMRKKEGGVRGLEELGEKIPGGFEVKIGRNGRVWVDCPVAGSRGVVAVGRCLREFDEGLTGEKEVKRCVNRIVAEMGLG